MHFDAVVLVNLGRPPVRVRVAEKPADRVGRLRWRMLPHLRPFLSSCLRTK